MNPETRTKLERDLMENIALVNALNADIDEKSRTVQSLISINNMIEEELKK